MDLRSIGLFKSDSLLTLKNWKTFNSHCEVRSLGRSPIDPDQEIPSNGHKTDAHANRDSSEKRDGEEFVTKTYTGSATFLKVNA